MYFAFVNLERYVPLVVKADTEKEAWEKARDYIDDLPSYEEYQQTDSFDRWIWIKSVAVID